jgi:HEAT repeat protein
VKRFPKIFSINAAIMFFICVIVSISACDGTMNAFSPYLNQYITAGTEGDTQLPEEIKAIVLVCDNQTGEGEQSPPNYRFGVSEYNKLPEEMRAETPEEVNTIIRITKMYDIVGNYVSESNGSTNTEAYAIRAYVTVINTQTGIIWVKDQMFYNDPPKKIMEQGRYQSAELAEVPMEAVVSFLREGKKTDFSKIVSTLNDIDSWQPYIQAADGEARQEAIAALLEKTRPDNADAVGFSVNILMTALEQSSDEAVRQDVLAAMDKLSTLNGKAVLMQLTSFDGSVDAAAVAKKIEGAAGMLTELVKNGSEDERANACGLLGKVGGEEAEAVLLAILKSTAESEGVRTAAAEGLGDIGSAKAIDALLAALKDDTIPEKLSVVDALSRIKDERVTDAFIAMLNGKDDSAKRLAITALGRIGDDKSVQVLIATMKNAKLYYSMTDIAIALSEAKNEHVDDLLIEAIKSKDDNVRYGAADALGRRKTAKAVDALIPVLQKDKNAEVRVSAAWALGEIGDDKAVDALLAAVRENHYRVSGIAVEALEKIKGGHAVELLAAALKDKDENVRGAAARALASVGDAKAVDALIDALKSSDSYMLGYVIEALGNIGDRHAVPPLLAALESSGFTHQAAAADALGKIGDRQAVPALCALLIGSDSSTMSAAARALGEIGDERAVEPLCDILGQSDSASAAVDALKKINAPACFDPLMKIISGGGNDRARCNAAALLDGMDEAGAAQTFNAALDARDLAVLAGAYGYYIKLGKEGSETLLISALEKFGEKGMAQAFLNCGNKTLADAGKAWADKNHYQILTTPGGGAMTWGSGDSQSH